jgi:hypothetical protein
MGSLGTLIPTSVAPGVDAYCKLGLEVNEFSMGLVVKFAR